MPPSLLLSQTSSSATSALFPFPPFLLPLHDHHHHHRHFAPLHRHHSHHYQQHPLHFLFATVVSRLLIKAFLATLLLTSLDDINHCCGGHFYWPSSSLLLPTLPTKLPFFSSSCSTTFSYSPFFFAVAHSLPSFPHLSTSSSSSNGANLLNSSSSLASVPILPSSPILVPQTVKSSHDAPPIADFESLLQQIDSISRRQHCTPTLLHTTAYNVPLVAVVQQQHQQHSQHQQSIVSMVRPPLVHQMHPPIMPIPSQNPSISLPNNVVAPPISPSTSFHHHQTVSIPVAGGSWLSDYLAAAFTDDERCRRTAKCVDLLASVLAAYDPQLDDFRLLLEAVQRTALVEASIYRLSVGWTLPAKVTTSEGADANLARSQKMRFHHCTPVRRKDGGSADCDPVVITEEEMLLLQSSTSSPNEAWLSERLFSILRKERHYMAKQTTPLTTNNETSEWSSIFYDCDEGRWFIAYRALILEPVENLLTSNEVVDNDTKISSEDYNDEDPDRGLKTWYRVKGVISAHVDVTGTDINQCEEYSARTATKKEEAVLTKAEKALKDLEKLFVSSEMAVDNSRQFRRDNARQLQQSQVSSHQNVLDSVEAEEQQQQQLFESSSSSSPPLQPPAHREQEVERSSTSWVVLNLYGTNKCHRENSKCVFKPGHGMFRGGYSCNCRDGFHSAVANLEPTFNGTAVEQSFEEKNPSYVFMFACKRCAPGCDVCRDDSPCLSTYDWGFRISLLTITVLCIGFVFVLGVNIYRYRRLKVIKVASPIFLCITLLGCAIMYCETVAIFPVLDTATCVLTKWTRNFGFCITYSALLLKTWRVSLTYRVKSAHKIKLTDKQLLQWLFPILLVMAIYLAAWTISDTPQAVYIVDWNELKFKQCDYNWWDHSLLIGEFFFLLWGIKVCYNVRNAESLFNEARFITYAIYNITIVNMVMILIHLSIVPNSGPDIKYFFGFLRTQLSTTTTVILIFGPKFYRIIKGQGDLWDTQIRARGIAASFSNGGVGMAEETTDLYQENEELKEEIQKLAAQLEIMKICQMQFKNRHLEKIKRYQQQETAKL